MKKIIISMLCVALCAVAVLTSCAKKEEENVEVVKNYKVDLTEDFVEEVPVFEYRFSGSEATLIGYNPESAEEPIRELVLEQNPVRKRIKTVETVVENDDGTTYTVKEKVYVEDTEKEYTLTGIDAGVFMYQNDLTKVVIPDTVEEIGNACFLGCENIKEIKLPEALVEINDLTFYGCNSLETLNIPSGVAKVGLFAFGEYFNKVPWYDNQTASTVVVGDGVLLKYNGGAGSVRYADEIKSVAYYAFLEAPLSTIYFTDATTDFDPLAFYRTKATVMLPEGSVNVASLRMNNVKVETYAAN